MELREGYLVRCVDCWIRTSRVAVGMNHGLIISLLWMCRVPGKRMLQLMTESQSLQQHSGQKRIRKRNRTTQKRKAPRIEKANDDDEEEEMTVAAAMGLMATQSDASVDEEEEEEEDYEEQASSSSPQPSSTTEVPEEPPNNKIWYHPQSKFEEPIPNYDEPDVTLYEKHRAPRQVPPHCTTGYCSVAAVQQEVRCGICLECVVRTRIVRECRHRFCEPCVERALTTAKECPICRTPIPSRRSLEPDLQFDALLRSVIGQHVRSESGASDDDGEEEHQRARMTSSMLQQAINKKREATEKQQLEDMNTSTVARNEEKEGEDQGSVREERPALIKILLHREVADDCAPIVDALTMPYLRIAGDAPVLVLKNFLRKKHRSKKQYSIWSILDGGPEILSDMTRLQFVANYLADEFEGDYMPLYYRETKTGGAPLV